MVASQICNVSVSHYKCLQINVNLIVWNCNRMNCIKILYKKRTKPKPRSIKISVEKILMTLVFAFWQIYAARVPRPKKCFARFFRLAFVVQVHPLQTEFNDIVVRVEFHFLFDMQIIVVKNIPLSYLISFSDFK